MLCATPHIFYARSACVQTTAFSVRALRAAYCCHTPFCTGCTFAHVPASAHWTHTTVRSGVTCLAYTHGSTHGHRWCRRRVITTPPVLPRRGVRNDVTACRRYATVPVMPATAAVRRRCSVTTVCFATLPRLRKRAACAHTFCCRTIKRCWYHRAYAVLPTLAGFERSCRAVPGCSVHLCRFTVYGNIFCRVAGTRTAVSRCHAVRLLVVAL